MLIITSNAITAATDRSGLAAWPQPHVLVIRPGSGWPRAAIRAAEADMTVIEYLQPCTRLVMLLQHVLAALRSTVQPITGPVLYLDEPIGGGLSMQAQADAVAANAHLVQVDPGGDGRVTRLLLGEMVATSPLLPELLAYLDRRRADDMQLAHALETPFLQAPA